MKTLEVPSYLPARVGASHTAVPAPREEVCKTGVPAVATTGVVGIASLISPGPVTEEVNGIICFLAYNAPGRISTLGTEVASGADVTK